MAVTTYHIDKADVLSAESLISAFADHRTGLDSAIRAALSIQQRPFMLRVDVDPDNPAEIPPMHDAFTFDIDTDELILFSEDTAQLVDALIEMAMYMRGFNTTLGVDEDWKTQVTIGAWRRVRERIKKQHHIPALQTERLSANPFLETVRHFNHISFHAMVFMAACVDLEVIFPNGAHKKVIETYQRLVRIMDTIAYNVDIDDYRSFNRRLGRALQWIEENILPTDDTLFDDLFGPDGFNDMFFDDSSQAP
jgi:hypothetical protein